MLEDEIRRRAAQLIALESSRRFGPLSRVFLIGAAFGLMLAALLISIMSD